jgi:hypothetical protein
MSVITIIAITDMARLKGTHHSVSKVRDSLEHRNATNTQGVNEHWDEDPLAWIISGGSLDAFTRFLEWLNVFKNHVDSSRTAVPSKTTEVQVVRGIEGLQQSKSQRPVTGNRPEKLGSVEKKKRQREYSVPPVRNVRGTRSGDK